ncbi:MAG TPA: hypothetical protein VK424_03815 [Thermoplasmata archaeon]|nr:hypothetical protein [Thermoplasmata archaeon]
MARAGGSTGIVGAVLVMVGLILVGAGLVIVSNADQTTINCEFGNAPNNCRSTDQNAANTSVDATYVIGGGLIVAGVGVALVVMTMLGIMAARLERPGGPSMLLGPPSWSPASPIGPPPSYPSFPPPPPPGR